MPPDPVTITPIAAMCDQILILEGQPDDIEFDVNSQLQNGYRIIAGPYPVGSNPDHPAWLVVTMIRKVDLNAQ